MSVEAFNIYYFLYILLAASFIVFIYFLLKNKDEKTQRKVFFAILMSNFVLHFAKLMFPPYVYGLPQSIHKASLENICSVSTVLFPFLFLSSKKSPIHDYIYFIGVMGGLAALIYPTEALGESPFAFDTIRFYVCHTSLIAVPLVAALLNYRRPSLKNVLVIPLMFLAHETIVMLNEVLLIKTGIIDATLESFLSRASRNNSFVHGPTPDMDGVGEFLTMFCPDIFKQDIFGINGGTDFFWPVVWLIIPVFVYFVPIYFLIATPVSKEIYLLRVRRSVRSKKGAVAKGNS